MVEAKFRNDPHASNYVSYPSIAKIGENVP